MTKEEAGNVLGDVHFPHIYDEARDNLKLCVIHADVHWLSASNGAEKC